MKRKRIYKLLITYTLKFTNVAILESLLSVVSGIYNLAGSKSFLVHDYYHFGLYNIQTIFLRRL